MGIEPTLSAWKAEVLPLNYTRAPPLMEPVRNLVEGVGFEPTKAEPADLQSAPFSHSGTYPYRFLTCFVFYLLCNICVVDCLNNITSAWTKPYDYHIKNYLKCQQLLAYFRV